MRWFVVIAALWAAAGACAELSADAVSTWGYVESVEGLAVTLDDGSILRLTDKTAVISFDGGAGKLDEIAQGVKVVATLAEDGSVSRVELFRPPPEAETFLSTMNTAGANIVPATVDGRVHPRSLALVKASFAFNNQYDAAASLVGGVTYQPPKGTTQPGAARFTIQTATGEVWFEKTMSAGEAVDFRVNFGRGAHTFILTATPEGQGRLDPSWCLWLDPRFVAGRNPYASYPSIYVGTARALVEDLRRGLGETKVEQVAVAQFDNVRMSDDQALKFLQEDLLVVGAGPIGTVALYPGKLGLGAPLPENAKSELQKLGAKYVLTGVVSDRGRFLVVSAALVSADTGAIVATARAVQ